MMLGNSTRIDNDTVSENQAPRLDLELSRLSAIERKREPGTDVLCVYTVIPYLDFCQFFNKIT